MASKNERAVRLDALGLFLPGLINSFLALLIKPNEITSTFWPTGRRETGQDFFRLN